MSKRIAFAHIEFVIDFDNYEEAVKYLKDNQGKGWHFEPQNQSEVNWYDKCINEYDGLYTVVVRKPYRDYNPGW